MKKTLSLIIPCYNEEATLEKCIGEVMQLADERLALEVIIVDDCSTDRSLEIARRAAAQYSEIKIFQHEANQGKGAALRTGFMKATGDYVGIQDADNEYNPLDYKKLLVPMADGRADVVYGSRYLRPETRKVLYFWHTQMNRFLTFVSNMFTNLGVTDMETCYKLFRREVIQEIAPKLRENRFGFEPEVTAHIAEAGCRVYECAISYNPRTYEEGKKIGWKDGIRALYCILHYGGHRAPIPMQLIIYFCIGLICAIVNIVIFSFLFETVSLFFATSLAFLIAAALNYLLCILILFRHKARWTSIGEIAAYFLAISIMLAFDYVCTAGMIHLGMEPNSAKLAATVLGFIGNFLLRKFLVF